MVCLQLFQAKLKLFLYWINVGNNFIICCHISHVLSVFFIRTLQEPWPLMNKTKSFLDFSAKAEEVWNTQRTSVQKSVALLNLIPVPMKMLVLLNGAIVQFVGLCLWIWRMFAVEKELVLLLTPCIKTSALTGKY